MGLITLNKTTIPLIIAFAVAIGFFISGLFEVLDYFIVKVLLFTGFGVLFVWAMRAALINANKKNRPEATLQDDSH